MKVSVHSAVSVPARALAVLVFIRTLTMDQRLRRLVLLGVPLPSIGPSILAYGGATVRQRTDARWRYTGIHFHQLLVKSLDEGNLVRIG